MGKALKRIGVLLLLISYVVIVNAIIVGYLAYKDSIRDNSKEKYDNLVKNIVVRDNINITHKNATDYLVFNEFKIRNDFKNFEKTDSFNDDTKYISYEYKDVKNKVIVSFDIDIGENDEQINASYTSDFIDKYNIKNDIDYIDALKSYKYKDAVYSYNKLKENAAAMLGAESYSLSAGDYYNIIEGDYPGLIKHVSSQMMTEVYLYHNNKTYKLVFNSLGYFSDEKIYDLISTIVIE